MVKRKNKREILTKETVIERLKSSAEELKKRVPVDRVYLYGSYVQGKPKPHSDIDIAVVSSVFGKNIIKETTMLMEAFEDVSLMVEPRAYSREEYDRAEKGSFLHDEIIQKGLLIA